MAGQTKQGKADENYCCALAATCQQNKENKKKISGYKNPPIKASPEKIKVAAMVLGATEKPLVSHFGKLLLFLGGLPHQSLIDRMKNQK